MLLTSVFVAARAGRAKFCKHVVHVNVAVAWYLVVILRVFCLPSADPFVRYAVTCVAMCHLFLRSYDMFGSDLVGDLAAVGSSQVDQW